LITPTAYQNNESNVLERIYLCRILTKRVDRCDCLQLQLEGEFVIYFVYLLIFSFGRDEERREIVLYDPFGNNKENTRQTKDK